MIKYFLLSLSLLCVLVMGVFGFRGDKFHKRPIILFPDMDRQDKVLQQEPSDFFADGLASRKPVAGTVPHGMDETLIPVDFGVGRSGYYYTGAIDDYYANGLPEELELSADNIEPFLRRGGERYEIYCAICHGKAADGKGVTSAYGIPGIANLHVFPRKSYPDGRLYDVITNGKGNMSGYGATIPVRDRWAIVAYVRALQASHATPAAAPTEESEPAEPSEPEAAPAGSAETASN